MLGQAIKLSGRTLREFIERVSDCPPEVIDGSCADIAENGFELGEDLFDEIEIGAVGRRVERGCAASSSLPWYSSAKTVMSSVCSASPSKVLTAATV